MTRTSEVSRKTGETDVTLSVGLDGSGTGVRATGVGFLDHMLDLLARHGRLDLEVQVAGDLQTGSHHTVEELRTWFAEEGFDDPVTLPPARSGRLYDWAYRHDLIIGSGVNVVGTRRSS